MADLTDLALRSGLPPDRGNLLCKAVGIDAGHLPDGHRLALVASTTLCEHESHVFHGNAHPLRGSLDQPKTASRTPERLHLHGWICQLDGHERFEVGRLMRKRWRLVEPEDRK